MGFKSEPYLFNLKQYKYKLISQESFKIHSVFETHSEILICLASTYLVWLLLFLNICSCVCLWLVGFHYLPVYHYLCVSLWLDSFHYLPIYHYLCVSLWLVGFHYLPVHHYNTADYFHPPYWNEWIYMHEQIVPRTKAKSYITLSDNVNLWFSTLFLQCVKKAIISYYVL